MNQDRKVAQVGGVREAIVIMRPKCFSLVRVIEDKVDPLKPSPSKTSIATAGGSVDSFTPELFQVLVERPGGFKEEKEAVQGKFETAALNMYLQEAVVF